MLQAEHRACPEPCEFAALAMAESVHNWDLPALGGSLRPPPHLAKAEFVYNWDLATGLSATGFGPVLSMSA